MQIYDTLSLHVKDTEVAEYLLKFREVEKTHMDFWEQTIRQFGIKPTYKLGNLTALASKLTSRGIGRLSMPNMLQTAFYIESLALWDYGYFLKRTKVLILTWRLRFGI